MNKILTLISSELLQFVVYGIIALLVIVGTAVLFARDKVIYQPFFGRFHPVAVMVVVAILGFVLLTLFLARGWFVIFQAQNWRGWLSAAALGALLAAIMILFDSQVLLPEDVNRPYPAALLFYPTIGFVVEIIFHVLPLAILLFAATALFKSVTFEQLVWPCIFFVALLEPFFQTWWGFSRPYPWWVLGIVALIIFLINLAQLALFKQYDFASMYALRLVYYLLWHVVWGVIRLRVLF